MSKGHRRWFVVGILFTLVGQWLPTFATVNEVKVLALNNNVYVAPGDRIAVARIELQDDGTADVWRSLVGVNAGEEDSSTSTLQIFLDGGNGQFDGADQPISQASPYLQGEAVLTIGRFGAGGTFLAEGYSVTGSVLAFVVAQAGTGVPGDLVDISVGAGSLRFDHAGSTGPPSGYFGASGPTLSGITDIAAVPLNVGRYVDFGERTEALRIILTANAGGDTWSSLTVSAASNGAKIDAFANLQLFRDNPQQVNGEETFGTLDAGDVAISPSISFGVNGHVDFVELDEQISGVRHYLIAVTAATADLANQGDLLDLDLELDSFRFANAGTTGVLYRGGLGPRVGNTPPTVTLIEPNAQDDLADESYVIQYEVEDADSSDALFTLYAAPHSPNSLASAIEVTLEKLNASGEPVVKVDQLGQQTGFENLVLIGTNIDIASTPQEFEWRTTLEGDGVSEIPEGDYDIYAVVQDIVIESDAQADVRLLRTVVGRSPGFVTIKHIADIAGLSPSQNTIENNGTYLITWEDQKHGAADGNIVLYYSSDPNLSTIEEITQQSTLIKAGLSENADGRQGQYMWGLQTSLDVFVPSGTYYLYGTIDGERWTRSTGSLQIVYPPLIKLVSPIAQGSKATDTFTISWIAQDIDENAEITLYYSRTEQEPDIGAFIDDLAGPSDESGQLNQEPLLEDDTNLYVWDIRAYEAQHSVQLTGSYHIYARITEPSAENTVEVASPGQLTIRRIDIRLHPSSIVVGANESFDVDVELNTNGIDVSAVSVYLSFDPGFLRVQDLDALKGGNQPFQQPTGPNTLFRASRSSTSVLENDTHGDTESTTGTFRLDYSVVDTMLTESPYHSDTFTKIATLRFTAKAAGVENAVNTTIGFDYNESVGRSTKVITANVFDDLSVISPVAPLPAMNVQIAPLASISGHIRLQGRSNHSSTVAFELRKPGTDVHESTYAPASTITGDGGDEDPTKTGIQVTARSDGSYQLIGVPAGRWELVAKPSSFLRGQYYDPETSRRALQVVAGDALQDIDIWNRYQMSELLGGDVDDDNRINIVDLTLLSNAFGTGKGDVGYLSNADMDGSGQIGVADFAILAQNFGEIGIPPTNAEIPPPAAPTLPTDCHIAISAQVSPVQFGQQFEWPVHLDSHIPLKGYALELSYDPELLEFLPSSEVEVTPSSLVIQRSKVSNGEAVIHIAEAQRGESGSPLGTKAISLQFRALGPAQAFLKLRSASLLGVSGEVMRLSEQERQVILLRQLDATRVHPNFPNPFNPDTWIPYELDQAAHVVLRIFDIQGGLVKRIDLGCRPSGVYLAPAEAIHWDGRNSIGEKVSSGVYFYQLQADSKRFTRSMLLVK